MTTTIAPPQWHRWLDRLSPDQQQVLHEYVVGERRLPPVEEEIDDEAGFEALLALSGAIDDPDGPTDYAENAGYHARRIAAARYDRVQ